MDPRMYNAAIKGNMEDGDFSLDEHLKREEENGYQVTPNGNTILHMATHFGQRGFVGEVLKITPGLLCYKNKKNETALHIAANVGQSEVVRELLSIRGGETVLVRMTDDTGDTALHKAVRGGHHEIVKMLVRLLDPELDFPANRARETPLYLAAESGFHDALIEILNVCKKPTYIAGPSKRTPLHAAVIQEHKECAISLWEWNKQLCEEADEWGCNSLHYAVKQGLKDLVSDMLEWKKSLPYLPAGSENDDWTTPFHIAASEGDVDMILELLKHCPDCLDMVNSKGQNALHVAILNHHDGLDNVLQNAFHVAILNHHDGLVSVLLELTSCKSLVDEADNEGNTPLHLLAAYGNYLPKLILDHPRAKKMAFNKQNQTPLDIALSRPWTINKEKLVGDLRSINGRLGQRDFNVNRKMKKMGNIQVVSKEDEQDKAKRTKLKIEKMKEAAQIQIVVAALLMTVAFTAGFTLPGGLENDDGPNKGMAILSKRAAFRRFVISDVLAFLSSFEAIILYHLMAHVDVVIDDENALFNILWWLYYVAGALQVLAMVSVGAAFGCGIRATLENSPSLIVGIVVTSGVFGLMFCLFFNLARKQKNLLERF